MTTRVRGGMIEDLAVGTNDLADGAVTAAKLGTGAASTGANTFTATQTVLSTDAGALEGPVIDLYRNSASPANADDVGAIHLSAMNDAGEKVILAKVKGFLVDVTDGSEDGKIELWTMHNGTLARRLNIGHGIWIDNATGGDPGAGKINAAEVQVDGVALPITRSYTSADQTITTAGTLTLAHGFTAGSPRLVQLRLKCLTAEHGYSIGDQVLVAEGGLPGNRGAAVVLDATNIVIRFGSDANVFNVNDKATGASAAATNANWALIVRAWR